MTTETLSDGDKPTRHTCEDPDCPCYLRGRESIVRERHEAEASGYVPPAPED